MATKTVIQYEEQSSVTGASDSFLLDPAAEASVVCSGSGSATLQVCIDPHETIAASGATWVNAPNGAQAATFCESLYGPISGVRLNVSSGTWKIMVRQQEVN